MNFVKAKQLLKYHPTKSRKQQGLPNVAPKAFAVSPQGCHPKKIAQNSPTKDQQDLRPLVLRAQLMFSRDTTAAAGAAAAGQTLR